MVVLQSRREIAQQVVKYLQSIHFSSELLDLGRKCVRIDGGISAIRLDRG